MRKIAFVAALCIGLSTITVTDVVACGDKLLAMGGGARYHLFHPGGEPASILLYKQDPVLQTAMKHGGYKVQVAKNLKELPSALRSKKLQAIVADASDVPAIKEMVESAPSKPVLVPLPLGAPKARETEFIAAVADALKGRK